jgi:hypothetical protein
MQAMHAHILVTTTDVHQLQHAMVKSVMPCVLQDPSNPCMHNTPNLLHRKDGLAHFPHTVTVVDVSHGVLPQTVMQAQGDDPALMCSTTHMWQPTTGPPGGGISSEVSFYPAVLAGIDHTCQQTLTANAQHFHSRCAFVSWHALHCQ